MEVKERILEASKTLCSRFGYKKTTVEEIAKAANIAKGTIYLHFKSKEDIFSEMTMRALDEQINKLKNDLDKPGDPKTVLIDALFKFVEGAIKDKDNICPEDLDLDGTVVIKIFEIHEAKKPKLIEVLIEQFNKINGVGSTCENNSKSSDLAWFISETYINIMARIGPNPDFDWRRYVSKLISL